MLLKTLLYSSLSPAPRCVPRILASLSGTETSQEDLSDLVAARLGRTRILAVTSEVTSYQTLDD